MADKPFMPVEDLIRETIPDPDHADGDNPGWFSGEWNPDSRELLIKYKPDNDSDPEYRLTEHVFRLGAQARVSTRSLGEWAYTGYYAACAGKSTSGGPLPSWDEMFDTARAAWQAAADAVRKAL